MLMFASCVAAGWLESALFITVVAQSPLTAAPLELGEEEETLGPARTRYGITVRHKMLYAIFHTSAKFQTAA